MSSEITDFMGVPIELGDLVIFADGNSDNHMPSSRSISKGIVHSISVRKYYAEIRITSEISGTIFRRDNKKVVNIQGLKDAQPEFFI